MNREQFEEATGATYRRLDYWARAGIEFSTVSQPGSGHRRYYEPYFIPHVKLLVKISHFFDGGVDRTILKKVFDAYELGKVELTDGLTLSWEVENGLKHADSTYASPREGTPPAAQRRRSLWRGWNR